MPWKSSVLVVANRTATSDDLLDALRRRAERSPARFALVVPATPPAPAESVARGRENARRQLDAALERMRGAGLEVDGVVGDCDPIAAVADAWDPAEFDEVVVSTLPTGASRWLAADLPRRAARLTGASVEHVVARERAPSPAAEPAAPRRVDWLAPLRMARRDRRGHGTRRRSRV